MKKVILSVCFVFLSIPLRAQQKIRFEDAITPTELASMARVLPAGPIYSMKLFREKSNARLSLAVLSSRKRTGWQLLLLSPSGRDSYLVSWKSDPLTDSFTVSDPRNLDIYGLSEEAVTFSGCAQHLCPDIFSVLLYVPSLYEVFTATCDRGITEYVPSNMNYKDQINELLRSQIGSNQACSAEVHGER